MTLKKKKLGEVLRERGHISSVHLDEAVAEQQHKLGLLGELLLERKLVGKADLISALEEVTRIPYVNCTTVTPEPEVLAKIPEELARRCVVFPMGRQGAKLIVVMAVPQDLAVLDEIKFKTGANVSPRLGFHLEIMQAIDRHYGGGNSVKAAAPNWQENDASAIVGEYAMEFISTSSRQANQDAIQETQAELAHRITPAVKIVCEVIKTACDKRASDIHIEPQDTGVMIRVRVDGVLRDLRRESRAIQNTLISRIKVLADMDIAERRNPQDGRFLVRMGSTNVDLRISTLPTQYGEKVVMRLLNASSGVMTLNGLNMPAAVESGLRRVLSLPQGMLLVTGPTGSGKSTTLYAALNHIRKPAVNIVTVEDPVEYVLPGINQVHVNNKAGLTFASCLRSILRQDPNVIMVGEIRDKETAEIAMKAAQTGHLVLSTLHTNDSLSAVTRLLDLGIPSFMIAASVTAILAQRLVRRLCDCHKLEPITAEASLRLGALGVTRAIDTLHVPVGCDLCDQTGYRGRIGVYELLEFDESICDAIRRGDSGEGIRNILRGQGMKLMQQDALEKIQAGITSLDEVARVVPAQALHSSECPSCNRGIVRTFQFCPHCGVKLNRNGADVAQPARFSSEEVVRS